MYRLACVLFIFMNLLPLKAFGAAFTSIELMNLFTSHGATDDQAKAFVSETNGIEIGSALFASDINFAFLRDSDDWNFSVTTKNADGSFAQSNIVGYLENGGFAFAAEYKWMWLLIPESINPQNLAGTVCGRGLGGTFNSGVGIEVGILPCQNRAGSILLGALNFGAAEAVRFPRITFKQN